MNDIHDLPITSSKDRMHVQQGPDARARPRVLVQARRHTSPAPSHLAVTWVRAEEGPSELGYR